MGMEDEMITETGSLLLVVVHRYITVLFVLCVLCACHCMLVVHVLVNTRSMCINAPPCCTLSVSKSVI